MSQMALLIIELVLCMLTMLILYKRYNKIGVYSFCIVCIILSSIMSLKTITLYNYDVNLGIIPFVSIFTVSNILTQKNGTEEAKTLLLITMISSIISFILLFLVSYMKSSNINLFMKIVKMVNK